MTKAARPARKRPRVAPATETVATDAPAQAADLDAPWLSPPDNPDALHDWIVRTLDIHLARLPLLDHHAAPFDYICHAFFEGQHPARPHLALPGTPDCVVWAARGAGKTFLGALATLLDLVFKPGVQVRILGGSLEQSRRMQDHLRKLFDSPAMRALIDGRPTARRMRLVNGSVAEILAASQTSVRGTRVQKVRCDEVDLFDPEVWAAAQLTTRSLKLALPGPWGQSVRGSVEALSTMHRPYGLMWDLVLGRSAHEKPDLAGDPTPPVTGARRRLFRWGILDVLENCGSDRACDTCSLHGECAGRAKTARPIGPAGHVSIPDAIAMKSRVDRLTWDAEMLCERPRRTESVYPEFDPAVHIYDSRPNHLSAPRLCIGGMDFGFRSETVVLLAFVDAMGVLWIEHEHAARNMTLDQHVAVIRGWIDAGLAGDNGPVWIGADPAGLQANNQSGRSNVDIMADAGLNVRTRPSKIDEGVRLVRARLRPASWCAGAPGRDAVAGRGWSGPAGPEGPRLLVHKRCLHLIEALERYHYNASRPEDPDPVKDGPDHACDALRYMVMNLDKPFKIKTSRY